VFYLYITFTGAMLHDVLNRLKVEAAKRPIRLCTLGPCTPTVAEKPWLEALDNQQSDRPALFRTTLPIHPHTLNGA
jgi:hypothetical protein